MKLAPRSLLKRVALTTALSVIGASAGVALISELLAYRMARTHEDTTLRDAAETFALELRAPGADPHWIATDEARELAHASIRVAVYVGDSLLAGDTALRQVAPDSCQHVGSLRVCARRAGTWLAVVGRDQSALTNQQRLGIYASLLAVLLTSGLGAFGALAIARVVTGPLDALRRAVEQVPPHNPGTVELGPQAGLLEVDALRESLRVAFVRLGAAMAQSRRFASDAAHELRTPLATLMGELELTAEHASDHDRQGLARAHRLTERMSSLINRLLMLARLDVVEVHERLEVHELVEQAIDTFSLAQRARVSLTCSTGAEASAVLGDRALLIASLVNALENALKFSADAVRVVLDETPHQLTVCISDSGPGIEAAEREQVFAAFYRTAASRSSTIAGHGIGLALIAHVMSLHGGSARFLACARGATLELSLPKAEL